MTIRRYCDAFSLSLECPFPTPFRGRRATEHRLETPLASERGLFGVHGCVGSRIIDDQGRSPGHVGLEIGKYASQLGRRLVTEDTPFAILVSGVTTCQVLGGFIRPSKQPANP